ncbi:exodeoxyribonuclease V subunit beta [Marinomonas sp. A79]|uniref:RecBCD enzyme subunit RecB n=1 Tax=Marinomonas vulgaris TaxID=2823372 RepID=A0ABS5HFF2_9GAMM|nr:exodeoxyribonuclease V subunit beta [Marinomonas vulgaris]MBR7890137.1 exodeoxyribonuclease V subunit beta [Marinomonas vulgaris]
MINDRQAFDVFKAPLIGSNLIEASAGTGKTWSITGLYLRMVVEKGLLPENILVVTFTKAATAELTGRIRQRLQQAMSWHNGNKNSQEAHFFTGLFSQWEEVISDDEIRQRLLKALARFDQAAIFTIHSFCQRVLNDYAFEAGGRFNLNLITNSDELIDIVVADFWRMKVSALSEDDKVWATWLIQQKQSPELWRSEIKNYINRPYQIILPPKAVESVDQALTQKVKELQQSVVSQWHFRKEDIKADLKGLMLDGLLKASSYKIDNLDTYVAHLDAYLQHDLTAYFEVASKEARKFAQNEITDKLKKNKEIKDYPFFTELEDLIECHDQYSTQMTGYLFNRKQNTLIELLGYTNVKLAEMKSEQSVLDFDSMLLNVYNALDIDQAEVLAKAVTGQYQSALIDEFQDTDPLQLSIFERLFAQTKTPLFYVGDPKQAIYSFRGADIHAYYQGAKNTDTQQTLLTNFRSSPALVDSVSALFSPTHPSFITENIHFDWVRSHPKKQLFIKDRNEAALQFVIAQNENGKAFSKGSVEPLAIANTVQQIGDILLKSQSGDAYFEDGEQTRSKVSPSDIAILVPTHKQAKMMAQALSRQGIMSVRQGQDKVLQSDAAYTLLRLMQAVAEPSNESRITELLADPILGFSGPHIVSLKEQGHEWETLLDGFWQLKTVYLENGFSSMFRSWLNTVDSNGQTLPQRLTEYVDGERNLTDLMHLAEIMQQRSRQQVSLKSLISWLQYAINGNGAEDEHQLRLESDTQRVKIVTLHACKGLEYNIVFCPFLWQGKKQYDSTIIAAHQGEQGVVDFGSEDFEKASVEAGKEQLMEQLRLLYVALTRPVHQCIIFWAHVQYGQYIYTANSALAWLLYGDDTMLDDPVDKLREKVKTMSFDSFVAGVEAFKDTSSNRHPSSALSNSASIDITIIQDSEQPTYIRDFQEDKEALRLAPFPTKPIYPSWTTASFSALTAGQHATIERSAHADDVPDMTEEPTQLDPNQEPIAPNIFTFPRGAMPGECLHSIFEHWDFQSTDKEALKTLVSESMNRFSIAHVDLRPQWYEPVAKAVLDVIHRPLSTSSDGSNFSLSNVTSDNRQAELEFLLSAHGSTQDIQRVLADPKYHVPHEFVEASQQLTSKHIQGYLMGFIDLVFKDDDDRYHVLDWKSNYLGSSSKDYAPELIEHAMAETHYYLQALLYLLALHRYLKDSLPHYNIEQHLGGAWYVFIRGVDISQPADEPIHGVYQFTPSSELILALDTLLVRLEVSAA